MTKLTLFPIGNPNDPFASGPQVINVEDAPTPPLDAFKLAPLEPFLPASRPLPAAREPDNYAGLGDGPSSPSHTLGKITLAPIAKGGGPNDPWGGDPDRSGSIKLVPVNGGNDYFDEPSSPSDDKGSSFTKRTETSAGMTADRPFKVTNILSNEKVRIKSGRFEWTIPTDEAIDLQELGLVGF
jgi:hypothetical protein